MIGPTTAETRLKEVSWLQDAGLQSILAVLDGAHGRTRVVGGAVRDTILEHARPSGDLDLATELLPLEVGERLQAAGLAVYPTGIDHGTLTVRSGAQTVEITTLREDVETDGRHALVRFGTDWHADASRRDFTLNALYAGPDGTLFDPIGGLTDCINQRVRFVGDADQRIVEDGLRVYRFFRFTASHGNEIFDADGLDACGRAASSLGHLSAERVGSELKRILSLPRCASALSRMAQIGVIDLSEGVLHALSSYEHQVADPSFATRLALVLDGESDPAELQSRWRLPNEDMSLALALRRAADQIEKLGLHEAVYRHLTIINPALDYAAIRAGWGEAGKSAVREKLFGIRLKAFPINGNDLIETGWSPGPGLGYELARLERLWIESEFTLDRSVLLATADRRPKA